MHTKNQPELKTLLQKAISLRDTILCDTTMQDNANVTFKDIAAAACMAGFKQVPIAGAAAELADRLEGVKKNREIAGRLSEVEGRLATFLDGCHERQNTANGLAVTMDDLRAIQQRDNALMFGGIIKGTDMYARLKSNPSDFGTVIPAHSAEPYDPGSVQLYVESDGGEPVLLKMPIFAFMALLERNTHRTKLDSSDGDVVATTVEPVSMDLIKPGTAIIICTKAKAKSYRIQTVLERLRNQYGIPTLFPEDLIMPGQWGRKSLESIAQQLLADGIQPILIDDPELEGTAQFAVIDRILDERRNGSILPVVLTEDGDGGKNTWRGLMAATLSQAPTPDEIHYLAAAVKGVPARQLQQDGRLAPGATPHKREEPPKPKL